MKKIMIIMVLFGASTAYGQITVEETANQRTNGLNDGAYELTYNFQKETDFILRNEQKEVVLEGHGKKANLGVLKPGVYWMLSETSEGRMVMDRFEVKR